MAKIMGISDKITPNIIPKSVEKEQYTIAIATAKMLNIAVSKNGLKLIILRIIFFCFLSSLRLCL